MLVIDPFFTMGHGMQQKFFYNIYKIRGFLITPPLVFAFFVKYHELENDPLIWSIGGLVFLLGVLLRIWAQMHIHYRLKVRRKLTTTGPYAITRNPIYIANTLIVCSLILLMELPWFVPFTFVWCISIYNIVIRHEESALIHRYGDTYNNYMAMVPSWIPRFLMIKESASHTDEQSIAYLWPSLKAEIHNILLLSMPIIKELLSHHMF